MHNQGSWCSIFHNIADTSKSLLCSLQSVAHAPKPTMNAKFAVTGLATPTSSDLYMLLLHCFAALLGIVAPT
jgi:hypothetical protein